SAHEGMYWSVQRNMDGVGVSYGILQWTQSGGGLFKVLVRMRSADPALFDLTFGGPGPATRMLAIVQQRSLVAVDGAYLWDPPWLGRFQAAGRIPVFQQAQIREAATSEYMQTAVELARLLGPRSERAMTMYFNRTVHQGAGGALGPAKRLVASWQSGQVRKPAADRDILLQYGWMCAAQFRRVGQPGSGRLVWRAVTQELPELAPGDRWPLKVKVATRQQVYHAFAGNFPVSLYELITHRTREILMDPTLRDAPVDLSIVRS
ncbi:MAG TPA: hypothetical protein PKY30_23160, partial [Myxococcota bacterium]|nr:hypothetical protein [Myxococcota bacterium]